MTAMTGPCLQFIDTGTCGHSDAEHDAMADESLVPTGVGFWDHIPEPAYHADRSSLSVSGAKTLVKAPALFRYEQDNRVYKDVFDFGSAAHKFVLGVGPDLVVLEPADGVKSPKATTAWKDEQAACRERDAILLLKSEYDVIDAMANKLMEHKTAVHLLSDGRAEVSAYAEHPDGVRMRCRYDYLADGWATDYKSTVSSDPASFRKSVANLGYDMQAAWYLDVAELCGNPLEAFAFVAQEKTPPYIVEVYQLDEEFLARGRRRNAQARALYLECMATGDWSGGYTRKPYTTLSPPNWTRYENEGTTP